MAQLIGTVATLQGQAFAQPADGGAPRALGLNDEVYVGETLITAPGAILIVDVPEATPIVMPSDSERALTEELLSDQRSDPDESVVDEATIAAVIDALESDGDLLASLDATPAGGTGDDDGSSFVRLTRVLLDNSVL